MNVTCIYARQGKPVLMTWLLNDEEVHHKYLVHYQPEKDELGRYRTALGLRFTGKLILLSLIFILTSSWYRKQSHIFRKDGMVRLLFTNLVG